jgi:hypothetical protein
MADRRPTHAASIAVNNTRRAAIGRTFNLSFGLRAGCPSWRDVPYYRIVRDGRWAVFVFAVALAGCGDDAPSTAPTRVPNFAGAWAGTFSSHQCSQSTIGDVTLIRCGGLSPSGSLRVTLTQTDTAVQGSIALEGFVVPVSGVVRSHGELSLTGHAQQQGRTLTVTRWQSVIIADVMTGAFTYTIDPEPASGRAVTREATFPGLSR